VKEKSGEIEGGRHWIEGHLEVGVEVGEADGGRVLDGAVGLAPALHRRHFCAAACSSPSPLSPLPSSLYFWPPGDAFDSVFFSGVVFSPFSVLAPGGLACQISPMLGVKMNKARPLFCEVA